MTTYDNPLAEVLGNLNGYTIAVERKDNDILLYIKNSSAPKHPVRRTAELVVLLPKEGIQNCQFVAHSRRAYELALRLIGQLIAHNMPPGKRCNISLEMSEKRRKRRSRNQRR